jgi:hypothetical protein
MASESIKENSAVEHITNRSARRSADPFLQDSVGRRLREGWARRLRWRTCEALGRSTPDRCPESCSRRSSRSRLHENLRSQDQGRVRPLQHRLRNRSDRRRRKAGPASSAATLEGRQSDAFNAFQGGSGRLVFDLLKTDGDLAWPKLLFDELLSPAETSWTE